MIPNPVKLYSEFSKSRGVTMEERVKKMKRKIKEDVVII